MSLKEMKRNRAASLAKLSEQAANAVGGKKNYDDERFWRPTRDKEGNGYAEIRFLPPKEGEDDAWIIYYDHGFKGPTGQWYIEKSLTTIGKDDPVGEMNSELWNKEGTDDQVKANRKIVRDRKRRLHYVANILVEKDPANPANEGKVFLYDFGKKIFEKLKDAMEPGFEDETPINPFDFWDGATFKVKVRKVEGWVNYDKSEFKDQEPLFGGDEDRLQEVYDQLHSLSDLISPDKFKSYDELKLKLNKVLCITTDEPSLPEKEPSRTVESRMERQDAIDDDDTEEDEEDALKFFKSKIPAE